MAARVEVESPDKAPDKAATAPLPSAPSWARRPLPGPLPGPLPCALALASLVALALGLGLGLRAAARASTSGGAGGGTGSGAGGGAGGGGSPTSSFLAVTTLIASAAPPAFRPTSQTGRRLANASDVLQRFFRLGPTDIWRILADLDDRTAAYSTGAACAQRAPTAFAITAGGADVTLYASCFDVPAPGFLVQFAALPNNISYLFASGGDGPLAAIINGSSPGAPVVDVWLSVGVGSARMGSYGAVRLRAEPAVPYFEVAVAGLGFGYCGLQLASFGNALVFANSSLDMGATCLAAAADCFNSSTLATLPSNSCSAGAAFALASLGRKATTLMNGAPVAASLYPGGTGNIVDVSGTATDTVNFGPLMPTPGLVQYACC